tara:strand:+ start:819 stop:1145 length:327 start_codon:yes stop_codon:yes gene_type:complete
MIILKSPLVARSGSKILHGYRAILTRAYDGSFLISIQKPAQNIFSGEFYGCGQWYLSTLLERFVSHCGAEDVNVDSLAIDCGQDWYIKSGLKNAVIEAATLVADNKAI